MRSRGVSAAVALTPVVLAATVVTACAPPTVETTLVVDGQRVAVHYVSLTAGRPLVLALHGLGSTGASFEQLTGLDAGADAHGFVVAYPDAHISTTPTMTTTPSVSPNVAGAPTTWLPAPGTTVLPAARRNAKGDATPAHGFVEGLDERSTVSSMRAWNAGYCCAGSTADDVTYLRHVVTAVAQRVNIDRRRVYVIGLSNGGMMALKAICDAPTVFAAAGTVAGPYLGATCARPVWLHLHDANDPIVPFYGGIPPGSAFLGVAKDWCRCSFPNSATEQRRFSPLTSQVVLVANGLHKLAKSRGRRVEPLRQRRNVELRLPLPLLAMTFMLLKRLTASFQPPYPYGESPRFVASNHPSTPYLMKAFV